MHVLLIARPTDGHVELVAKHLTVPYTLVNTRAIRDGLPFTFETTGKAKARILYDGVELKDVTAVWCKKSGIDFKNPKFHVDKAYEDYSHAAVRDFARILSVSFEDAFWISPYPAMMRAANKAYHLQVAKRLGFAVPDTLMTSDPEKAKAFVNSRAVTIAKPFMPKVATREGGGGKFFFAVKIRKNEPLDYDLLPIAPLILQTAIDQQCDIRVFVVGQKLFAASIMGDESESAMHRDWRMSQFDGSMKVAAHELPQVIAKQCLKLMREMELVYGAIDLLLDKKGKYWFLEVNTTGAWRFVEERTGQPIAAEIAHLLSTAGKGR